MIARSILYFLKILFVKQNKLFYRDQCRHQQLFPRHCPISLIQHTLGYGKSAATWKLELTKPSWCYGKNKMLLYQPSANIRVEISDLLIDLLPIPFKRASIKIFSRDRFARENFDRAFKKIDAFRRIEIEPNLSISKSKSIPSQEIFSNRLKLSKQKIMRPVFYPGSVEKS